MFLEGRDRPALLRRAEAVIVPLKDANAPHTTLN